MIQTLLALLIGIVGTPLFIVMAVSALLNHWRGEIMLQGVVISFYQLADQSLLQTLPLFAFAGYLLAHSRAPARLLRMSRALLGWFPGGLPIVAIVACSLMTAFTGASGVTIVALGGLLLPGLLEEGYDRRFSLGVITAGGSLGLLFAPSLPIILYGVVSETRIDHLFVAGVVPGLMIVTMLSLYGVWRAWRDGIPRHAFSWSELGASLWEAKWEVPLPFLVLGGIYGGRFTVSEAAVVAAAYVLVVEVVIWRDVAWRKLGAIARESMVLVGGILIILGMTMAVTSYIIDAQVPTQLFDLFSRHMNSRIGFLIVLNLFLLVVGCMIDIYAATVLIVPLIIPIAEGYGIDPLHLGIIFLTNLGIGYCTPPVGLNLFIASIRFREPVVTLYRAALPFLLVLLIALLAVTWIPWLTLWLVPAP